MNDFVRESNRIEGIDRNPTRQEVIATEDFCELGRVTITDLCKLVAVYQPDARPRFVSGLDVRVGSHVPKRGGPAIQGDLRDLLDARLGAYAEHIAYETLHPFTDGNGRSGRALWLRTMGGIESAPLGFLHTFYYQSLQASRP